MEIKSKQQILDRRKEIEQELVDILKETDPTSLKLRRGKEQFYQRIGITPVVERKAFATGQA